MSYIPLRLKSCYSLLSSLITIDKLINKSLELNIKVLALADFNNMYATMEFINKCRKNNITPLIGVEFSYQDSIIILYAKSYKGYQNLTKLTTIKSKEDLKYEDLANHNEDLLLIIPYEYMFLTIELAKIFPDFYIGYEDILQRQKIIDYKCIYLNNIVMLEENDYEYLKYLYLIKENKDINDISENNNNFLDNKNITNLIDPTDLINYENIAQKCSFEFKDFPLNLPQYCTDCDAFEYLESLALTGLKKRFDNNIDTTYLDRLKYELSVIKEMNFANYFLIVFDFVRYAKKNKIAVGPGRGSAAGSLVAYALGIVNVNPLAYNLYFERFLNPKRITLPDIDIDFDASRRDEVINYVLEKYGNKRVAEVITFGTLASRQAVRDVGKAMGFAPSLVDDLASLLNPSLTLTENYHASYRLQNKLKNNPTYQKWYKVASKLENLPRHTSRHAAGIVMSNNNLDEILPLKYDDGVYLTGYSSEYLESLGLLKMDFLGLKNLTMISSIVDLIYKETKNLIDINNIDTNNEKVLKIFHDVDTLGVFQAESSGMKNFLRKLKISSFDEIIASLALFRPGPMDNIDSFIKRKEGREKISYVASELEEILKETYGIIVYQEQIMQIALTMADYDLGEADVLRRAMSKKKADVLAIEEKNFISRCNKKGYSYQKAKEVFDLIFKFASYGFNKSHSVAYAYISYQTAYLKAYYPLYFYTYLLDMHSTNSFKIKEIISEARRYGINIAFPNINKSKHVFIKEEKSIRFSLSSIKAIGALTGRSIEEKQPYDSFLDFIIKNQNLSHKVITNLILSGTFDCFGYNRHTLIENLDNALNYASLNKNGSLNLLEPPLIEEHHEYGKEYLLKQELELFGFYLTMHPVNRYKTNLDINLDDISNYFDKTITFYGLVESFKIIDTKNKTKMAFLTVSDDTETVEVTIFEKELLKYNNIYYKDILKITGRVEKRFDKYYVVLKSLEKMIKE